MYNTNGLSRIGTAIVSIMMGIIGFIALSLFSGKMLDMGKSGVSSAKTQSDSFISESNNKINDWINESAKVDQ
jgi:hypothetical protein